MKKSHQGQQKSLTLIQRCGLALLGAGLIALGRIYLTSVPAHYTTSHRHELDPVFAILIGLVLIFVAFN